MCTGVTAGVQTAFKETGMHAKSESCADEVRSLMSAPLQKKIQEKKKP